MNVSELRKKFPNKEKTISEISLLVQTRSEDQANFSLLLGSGASVTSGIRSGKTLVEHWSQALYKESKACGTIASKSEGVTSIKSWLKSDHLDWYDENNEYASFFQKKFDLPSQRRIFIEGEVKNAKPSLGYCYLTDLVCRGYFNTVFTTNFDDLINEAFYRFGNIRPIVCAHDSSVKDILVTAKRPKIIKLHGDYLFDDLKCTPELTEKLSKNMNDKLEQFLREYGLIVCGYSGEDGSVMDVLYKLIENDSFLRNGLYWCVRNSGDISDKLLQLLEKDKAYFVEIDGYDEFFSQLHNRIIKDQLSFEQRASDGGQNDLVDHWIENSSSYSSNDNVIQTQLQSFRRARTKSRLGSAFADLYSERDESNRRSSLSDEEAAKVLRISTALKNHDYNQVIELTDQLIESGVSKNLKKELMVFRYNAYKKMGYIEDALSISEQLIASEKDNPNHYLRKSDVTEGINNKLICIDQALEIDRYHSIIHNKRSEKIIDAIEKGDIELTSDYYDEVLQSYRLSQVADPSYRNSAWISEVDFILNTGAGFIKKEDALKRAITISEKISKQDPTSLAFAKIAKLICENQNDSNALGECLFNQFERCLTNSYPKYRQSLFPLIVSAAIEFDNHDFAEKTLSVYEKYYTETEFTSKFLLSKAEFYLEVFRDVDEAIEVLTEAIEIDENTEVIDKLIRLLNYQSRTDKSEIIFDKYKHILSPENQVFLEHEIFIAKGEYDLAESSLLKANSGKELNEKYAMALTYLALISEQYDKARNISFKFLSAFDWSRDKYPVMIINHEFSLLKLEKSIHKQRLNDVINGKKNLEVEAMANIILGNEDNAIDLMKKSANKKFSNYLDYMSWPITASVRSRFEKEFVQKSSNLKLVS